MSYNSCCDPFQATFDLKGAKKEMENYIKNGPKKMTRPLLDFLRCYNLEGLTLLDIGSGIGAISFELFKEGIAQSTCVDISEGYAKILNEEANKRDLTNKINSKIGDFVALSENILVADIVTLDKVICCYENYHQLVALSLAKSKKYYAYILPRDTWWVKMVQGFGEFTKRFTGDKFKTFVHPISEIDSLVKKAGFQQIGKAYKREWLIAVFEKVNP